MSVTLRKRKNADGSYSLRLDIYHNGQRYYELLKNLKLAKPSNIFDRENNKELLKQAESIRVARAAELDANGYNLVSDAGKKTSVILWMESYIKTYTKKDIRTVEEVLNRFKDFLSDKKKPI